MRLAEIAWFVFSAGGACVALLGFAGWLLLAPKSKRARLLLALTATFYTVTSIYPLSHAAGQALGRSYRPFASGDVPPARTIIVLLGSGSFTMRNWSGEAVSLPDTIGAERAVEAARVFKLIAAERIISSGGRVNPDDQDEPSGLSMQSLLVWLGVPEDRIVIEQDSRNTHDEAVLVKALLPSLGAERVVVVTSVIHMRRSLKVFSKAGIDAIPAVAFERDEADDWMTRYLPSGEGLRESGMLAHELLGFVYYKARGWI